MSDQLEVLDRLLKKDRLSKSAREALGQVLSGNIINPSAATGMFNCILLRLELVESWSDRTGKTDGTKLWYNPEFVDGLSHEQREWFMAHEGLHVALAHPARMVFCEDKELANVAADLVVNQILKEAGLTSSPPGCLFPGQGNYAEVEPGLDFETTYERLLKKKQSQQQPQADRDEEGEPEEEEQDDDGDEAEGGDEDGDEDGEGEGASDQQGEGDADEGGGDSVPSGGHGQAGDGPPCEDPGGSGGVVAPGDGSPAAAANQEAEAQIMMAEAEAIARMQGNQPASLEKLVQARKKKVQDWRARLRDWMTRRGKDRLGWDRVKSWGVSRGIYLPGKSGKTLGKIVIAVDTSGSCWSMLDTFASEMGSIVEDFPATKLIRLYCDCRINKADEFDPEAGEPFKLEAIGGGGTSHLPVFEWIGEHHPDVDGLICFTDMYTDFPPPPNYDVLWAVAGCYTGGPPFGEMIVLDK